MKRLYQNWWVHNLIAHPLMQLIQLVSVKHANLLHDSTLPDYVGNDYRNYGEA